VATSIKIAFLALAVVTLASTSAVACGWWGDGESDEVETIDIGKDGKPVSQSEMQTLGVAAPTGGSPLVLDRRQSLVVPSPRSGFGIVVQWDGTAIPYREAVGGKPLYAIQQLRQAGFLTVIDLGTSAKVATLHRQETEALGMTYYSIPLTGAAPGFQQISRFSQIVSVKKNRPTLVFGASATLLGEMWVAYRLHMGASKQQAIHDGLRLGVLPVSPPGKTDRAGNAKN